VILSIWLPDFLYRGIEKMEIITYRFLISKTISTGLTFVLVHSKDDILWIPVLSILGSAVAVILTWIHIKTVIKIENSHVSYKDVIIRLKESTIYFVSTFTTTAYGAINTFMLGVMNLPSSQIAFWSVSYNLISAAQSLYTPITNSLYPHMVIRKDYRLVKRMLSILMPIIVLVTIIVFIYSDKFILLFCGAGYESAVPVFRALLPVLVFSFPAMIIGFPVLGVMKKVKETTTTTIISAVFHVSGLVVLALSGHFTIINIAILRSITEFVLLFSRGAILVDLVFKKRGNV
jgi:polysaccharide transporter, PST family